MDAYKTSKPIPFKRRPKKQDSEDGQFDEGKGTLSPIDLITKKGTFVEMGQLSFENLWKPSLYTMVTNTGSTVKFLLSAPCMLKWKPISEVSHVLESVELYWGKHNESGSCHSVDGKKCDLEMVLSFVYKYQVIVPAELIQNRLKLHVAYQELADIDDDETDDKMDKENEVSDMETYYDELEEFILNERYTHSEAREALSQRKPTSFNIRGQISGALPTNKKLPVDDDVDDENISDESENKQINFDRDIRFKKEKAIHELAAERFKISFDQRKSSREASESVDVEELLTQRSSNSFFLNRNVMGNVDSATSLKDAEIDPQFFPTEVLQARERLRRSRFEQEYALKKKEEEMGKIRWIRNHEVAFRTHVSLLFEVVPDAPFYNAFTYLPCVTEPFTQVWADGNLLLPFQEALSSPDFFAYKGSRIRHRLEDDVVWVVMKNTLPLSKGQLSYCLSLKNGYGKQLVPEKPNTQPLNNREIYINVPTKEARPITCPGKDLCFCEKE